MQWELLLKPKQLKYMVNARWNSGQNTSNFKYLKIIARFRQFSTAAISHVGAQHAMPRERWDRPFFRRETVGASGPVSGLEQLVFLAMLPAEEQTVLSSGWGSQASFPAALPQRNSRYFRQRFRPRFLQAEFPQRSSRRLRSSISGRVSGPLPSAEQRSYLGRQRALRMANRQYFPVRYGSRSGVHPNRTEFLVLCNRPIHGVTLCFFRVETPIFLGILFFF